MLNVVPRNLVIIQSLIQQSDRMEGKRMQKYLKTAIMVITNGKNVKFLVIAYVFRLLRILILLSIWKVILPRQEAVSGMTLPLVLTYAVIAEVFGDFLNIRSRIVEELCYGNITTRFLRPMRIFTQIYVETMSRQVLNMVFFSLPLFLLSPVLGVNPLPSTAAAFGLFLVSLFFAIIVGIVIDIIFAAFTISLENSLDIVNQVRSAITMILSGAVIPLALLPWGIGDAIEYLPFASLASAPLKLYIGKGEPVRLLLLQLLWGLVLSPIAFMLWNRNREHIISYGG
jgi:ABC-2 type transport system permease protein